MTEKKDFGFIKEITFEQAQMILKKAEEKNVEIYLLTEWGAVGDFEKAKFFVNLGDEEDNRCFIGTMNMLQQSKDGIFVRMKEHGKEEKMPNFEDVFEIKEY